MQDSTEEIARRILESVLRQLDGGARQPAAAPAVNPTAGNGASQSPVIVIMLGDPKATRTGSTTTGSRGVDLPLVVKQADCGCQNNSHAAGGNSLQSSHPGLERFDLPEKKTGPNAPRSCFMEPDRVCVSSGACEMRGY
ncbi:MAG: hypothetical protein V7641_3781 [Blastocatellia bacterium]